MTTKKSNDYNVGVIIGLLILIVVIAFSIAYCAGALARATHIAPVTNNEMNMKEDQINALIQFVRREAEFAEMRAKGQHPSFKDVREAEEDLREALRDER
jgi:uncharacterized alpha-E superfamily protein